MFHACVRTFDVMSTVEIFLETKQSVLNGLVGTGNRMSPDLYVAKFPLTLVYFILVPFMNPSMSSP